MKLPTKIENIGFTIVVIWFIITLIVVYTG